MSYSLPQFNLTCNIWRVGSPPPLNPPALSAMCNLAMGRRAQIGQLATGSNYMALLLPAATDVRDFWSNGVGGDWVEVPAGSGRFYEVVAVDDVGKGFLNEHRVAFLNKTRSLGDWPSPIP